MKTYTFFKKSKRSQIFIEDENGNFFRSAKDYSDSSIIPVTAEEAGTFRRITWTIQAETIEDARYKWVGEQIAARNEANEAKAVLENQQAEKRAALLKMAVIPTTIENLSLVLEHLNTQNWGTWNLPQMTIGYSAHQYDCDGKQISTITLDRPIEFCGRMETRFKSGSKRGHLEKYNCI
ncbi:MAG: hypothetical protein WC959_12360 [Kiritimatiellales bacterium]